MHISCRSFLVALIVTGAYLEIGCEQAKVPSANVPSASGPPAPPAPPGGSPPPPPSTTAPAAATSSVASSPAKTPQDGKPDFTITAEALHAETQSNHPAADAKYAGKTLEVEGVVGGMASNGRVSLADRHPATRTLVECEFQQADLWKLVARGSKVKVKGQWKTSPQDAVLTACVFSDVGSSPRITTTPDQLSTEARANRDEFRAKYQWADLLVNGEVEGVRVVEGQKVIVLKTSAEPFVVVKLFRFNTPGTPKLEDEFPSGKKVSLVGSYNDAEGAKRAAVFLGGYFVEAGQ